MSSHYLISVHIKTPAEDDLEEEAVHALAERFARLASEDTGLGLEVTSTDVDRA